MESTLNNPPHLPRRRRLAFRLLAVLTGLAAMLILEGSLRLTPWGRFEDGGDPFVGFSDVVPLFVLNDTGDKYEISKSRQVFFRPDAFAAQKGENEFRVFCFGGSTVQGRPYAIETSFTTWLELSLTAADPSKTWQVVNCGGVSYASYRLIPIIQEVLGYKPDLLVVYTGHNEFLEERTYADLKYQPRWIKSLNERFMDWRICGLARKLLHRAPPPSKRDSLPTEVDALLDYQGGLARYHRNDAWRDGVIHHYEHNLRRIVRLARHAGVPILLVNPVSNIRDTTPFKVEIAGHLTAEQKADFERLWEQAKSSDWQDLKAKADLVKQVLAMDDRHAEAHFLLARVFEAMGDVGAAKREYLRAKDEDICPLRMTESMHDIVKDVAKQTGTDLIDVRGVFESKAKDGIPGDDQLIDHVHPRIEGHQVIAAELLDHLISRGTAVPQSDWEARRQELYRANYAALPASYFPKSLSRLEGLQKWAQGRATKLRLPQGNR